MRKTRTRFYCGLMEKDGTPITKNVYLAVMNKHFTGYTVYTALGYWQGEPEPSVVIEVITPTNEDIPTYTIAEELRVAGNQHAVLITKEDIFADWQIEKSDS